MPDSMSKPANLQPTATLKTDAATVAAGQVCVVGLGYIGLPTAAVLASRGRNVFGVEVSASAREIINAGKAHIIEPDLDMLVQAGIVSGKLHAHEKPQQADVFMLCVPTPVGEEQGADLSYVRAATQSICPYLRRGNLIILESTSPPGTTEMIAELVYEHTDLSPGDLYFAHAPERVLPGRILEEVVQNDRIIGGIDDASTEIACAFYATFVKGQLIRCHCRMAEMAKLTENASRDAQIAFANELSMLCEDQGLEVRELIDIANRHPRVNILQPGCGVGGHCIAVDPWFLIHMNPQKAQLMQSARAVNARKPQWVVERVVKEAQRFNNPVIACLGAAYKPDVDDLRESPALQIIRALQDQNVGEVLAVEPHVADIPGCTLVTLDDAITRADIVVMLVNHRPFHRLTTESLAKHVVIDTCGALYTPPLPREALNRRGAENAEQKSIFFTTKTRRPQRKAAHGDASPAPRLRSSSSPCFPSASLCEICGKKSRLASVPSAPPR